MKKEIKYHERFKLKLRKLNRSNAHIRMCVRLSDIFKQRNVDNAARIILSGPGRKIVRSSTKGL